MHRHVAVALMVTAGIAIAVSALPPSVPPREGIGRGPGPVCSLPPRLCTARCDELVKIAPIGDGYIDVHLDAEADTVTSTSYLRRDLMMLVQYAAAKVACKAADWSTGNGGLIALGDMSERDGATPGTRTGSPRHPPTTHTRGRDIDIAYFQRDTLDNQLRPICKHRAAGVDQYRCMARPTTLDAWRTAMFIGAFLEDGHVRVIGVDGKAGPPILAALDELCATAWIDAVACSRRDRVRWELEPTGRGWFRGHHNHLHVSWWAP